MFNSQNLFRFVVYIVFFCLSGCVSAKQNTFGNADIDAIETASVAKKSFVSNLEDRPSERRVFKKTKIAEPVLENPKFTKPSLEKQSTQAIAVQTDIKDNVEKLVVKAPEENAKTEKSVSKQDDKSSYKGFHLQGVYSSIVNAALTKESFAEEALLRSSEHALSAHKQELFPQIRPGASVNAEGDTVLQLNVDQVLYDSGHHTAGRKILLSQQSAAKANYRIEQNDRATRAIASYIEYHRIGSIQKITKEIVAIFQRYEKQSQDRIYSGIGDNSESDLFQVKKLQAETDFETLGSEKFAQEQEFKSLTGTPMVLKKPVRLGVMKEFHNSPDLALAKAEQEEAVGNLELDDANRKPRISLNGNVGAATDRFDEENMDLRIEVSVNQPLTWGYNHALASSRSDVDASNIRYDKAVRDNRDKVKKLLLELKRAEGSLKRLSKLERAANARVKGFNEQFLAGKASINEAASIIDSYKQIKTNLKETEFRIFVIELEIASISGLV